MNRRLSCFVLFVAIGCCALNAHPAAAAITINFDSFSEGVQPANFLSAFGISSVTFSGAAGAGGPRIYDFSGDANSIVPSSPNVLIQDANSLDDFQIHRLTFAFSQLLSDFSLTRIGKQGGGSTDTWTAYFYDSSHTLLGSFGESDPQVDAPPQVFSFHSPSGNAIASMDLESVWTEFATHRNIPVDNFVLVPEPSSICLAGMGMFGAVAVLRRRLKTH